MAMSNAERQRRFRERAKERALGNEFRTISLAEAWEAASVEERRAFCDRYELTGAAERAMLAAAAVEEGKRQAGEVFNEHVNEVVERQLRAATPPATGIKGSGRKRRQGRVT